MIGAPTVSLPSSNISPHRKKFCCVERALRSATAACATAAWRRHAAPQRQAADEPPGEMSSFCMPMIIVNMGGEMVYILEQRLHAQNVPLDKSKRGAQLPYRARAPAFHGKHGHAQAYPHAHTRRGCGSSRPCSRAIPSPHQPASLPVSTLPPAFLPATANHHPHTPSPSPCALAVLQDVIRTMYNPKFIAELFRGQDVYSMHATRQVTLGPRAHCLLRTCCALTLYSLCTLPICGGRSSTSSRTRPSCGSTSRAWTRRAAPAQTAAQPSPQRLPTLPGDCHAWGVVIARHAPPHGVSSRCTPPHAAPRHAAPRHATPQLFDLMTMGFKYQLIACRYPQELLHVTLNHLHQLRAKIDDAGAVAELVEEAIRSANQLYGNMSAADFGALKQARGPRQPAAPPPVLLTATAAPKAAGIATSHLCLPLGHRPMLTRSLNSTTRTTRTHPHPPAPTRPLLLGAVPLLRGQARQGVALPAGRHPEERRHHRALERGQPAARRGAARQDHLLRPLGPLHRRRQLRVPGRRGHRPEPRPPPDSNPPTPHSRPPLGP